MDNNNKEPLQNEAVDNQVIQPVQADMNENVQPTQPEQTGYTQPEQSMQPGESGYVQPMQPGQTGYAQPMQPGQTGYAQPMQPGQTGYAQPMQPGYGQTGYVQPMQSGYGQTGYVQPMQPGYGQTGYAQPMQPGYGQTGYAQPMQPGYGQPMQPGQPGYGQPYMQNQAPKPPRKPLSKKAKIGIIAGAAGVVVLVVFFAVILPILTRAKLAGEYRYKDSWDDTYTIVFDDGTYVCYDYDDEIDSAGTYVNNKGAVVLTDIEGDTTKCTFDSDNNTVRLYGDKYTSSNKKAKIGFKIPTGYQETLENQVKTAVDKLVQDKDLLEIAKYNYYCVNYDDLKDPSDDFLEALAKELNYSGDKMLSTFIEDGYVEINIDVDSNGNAYTDVYIY